MDISYQQASKCALTNTYKAGVDIDLLCTVLDRGADINAVDDMLHTALHHAAEKEDALLGRFLLDSGARVDPLCSEVIDNDGQFD